METIKGWTVLTSTISGWELVWNTIDTTGEDDIVMPQVFKTERAAQLEILKDIEDDIHQFKEGEREWDEIHWPADEYSIVQIEIDADGKLTVFDESESIQIPDMVIKGTIIETSLSDWRKQL